VFIQQQRAIGICLGSKAGRKRRLGNSAKSGVYDIEFLSLRRVEHNGHRVPSQYSYCGAGHDPDLALASVVFARLSSGEKTVTSVE
jgi:hypothetical protein